MKGNSKPRRQARFPTDQPPPTSPIFLLSCLGPAARHPRLCPRGAVPPAALPMMLDYQCPERTPPEAPIFDTVSNQALLGPPNSGPLACAACRRAPPAAAPRRRRRRRANSRHGRRSRPVRILRYLHKSILSAL